MNNLNATYERILEILGKISKNQLLIYQRQEAKLFDLQIKQLNFFDTLLEHTRQKKYVTS